MIPLSVAGSHTIVRQVKGGDDPASHRFVVLSETRADDVGQNYAFNSGGVELTLRELRETLLTRGISEEDIASLINDAIASFDHP